MIVLHLLWSTPWMVMLCQVCGKIPSQEIGSLIGTLYFIMSCISWHLVLMKPRNMRSWQLPGIGPRALSCQGCFTHNHQPTISPQNPLISACLSSHSTHESWSLNQPTVYSVLPWWSYSLGRGSLVPRPRPAFHHLKYINVVEGLDGWVHSLTHI